SHDQSLSASTSVRPELCVCGHAFELRDDVKFVVERRRKARRDTSKKAKACASPSAKRRRWTRGHYVGIKEALAIGVLRRPALADRNSGRIHRGHARTGAPTRALTISQSLSAASCAATRDQGRGSSPPLLVFAFV